MISTESALFQVSLQKLIEAVIDGDEETAKKAESLLSAIREQDKGKLAEYRETRTETLRMGGLQGMKNDFTHTVKIGYVFINDLLYFDYKTYHNNVVTNYSQMRCYDPSVKTLIKPYL
jgi:hypothetical protein